MLYADVEHEALEQPSGKRAGDAESMTSAEPLRRRGRPLDAELEPVAGALARSIGDRLQQLFLVGGPLGVDVFREPRTTLHAEVQGEPTFEQPTSRGNVRKAGKQPLERDPLSLSREAPRIAAAAILQPLLEGLAERPGIGVLHARSRLASRRAAVTRSRARTDLPADAAWRRRGVVHPRAIAWLMAASICSG